MKKIGNTGSFKNFYLNNQTYVDKTEYIYNLLNKKARFFISRPRRFGKTLTLDTIATLFKFGVEPYFKGTWIYDKWTEPTYPVFRLSFLNLDNSSIGLFKKQLNSKITDFANKIDVKGYVEKTEPEDSIGHLLEQLRFENRQIVILIDEYDYQLTSNINNGDLYKQFQTELQNIYNSLKDKWAIKFLLITGVTKTKNSSVFSGTDINDITNYSPYSQLIGFTRDEIKKYYIDYLKLASSYENNCSVDVVTEPQIEAMLDKLEEQYGGYCFDEDYEKKVFNTLSVNDFFHSVVANKFVYFDEYWYDNGGVPKILSDFVKNYEQVLFDCILKGKFISVPTSDLKFPPSLISINPKVLMCQTGYLTLRSDLKYFEMLLGIPNGEIYKALSRLLAKNIFKGNTDVTDDYGRNLLEVGSVDDIIKLFNSALNTVSYDDYPIVSESSVQNMIKLYLLGAHQEVLSEVHEAKGRADFIVNTDNRRIVFEFKYAKDETEAKTKLSEAVEQIKSRDYGNVLPKKDELIRIAVVFNADPKVRSFSKYQLVI